MFHRPTSLRMFAYACAHSMKLFAEREKDHVTGEARMDGYSNAEQEVEGPELAEIGIAFHACVHAAALAEKEGKPRQAAIEATALVLTQRMNAVRVRTGADMAQDFVMFWEFDPRLNFEHGLSFDKKWKPVAWDSEQRRIRMVLDAYGVIETEDEQYGAMTIAKSEDYKTGWGANDGMLDEIQALAHSTAMFNLHKDEVQAIEVNIISTRRHKSFKRRWILDDDADLADLRNRQLKLEFYMNAAESSDLAPRLGLGCASCNFTTECQAFKDRIASIKQEVCAGFTAIADREKAAVDLILLETRAKELKTVLKKVLTAEPLEIQGGTLGFVESKKRHVKDPVELLEFWFSKAGAIETPGDAKRIARGFVKTVELGVGQMDKVLGALSSTLGYKSKKAAKEELSPRFTDTEASRSFKFTKLVGEKDDEEGSDE